MDGLMWYVVGFFALAFFGGMAAAAAISLLPPMVLGCICLWLGGFFGGVTFWAWWTR